MGPLSTPAYTTAIIAGKACGDLACFCPGQLERESFDNDNAAGSGNERETFPIPYAVKELNLRRVAWISLVCCFCFFKKPLFDL